MRERSDRALAMLLVLHFPLALALATVRGTWLAALVIGGLASAAPLLLAYLRPGAAVTRIAVAICLMVYSMLMIAQTGGMIEMHFHVFASMAFLLIYRDWRLPVIAGGIIAVHHAVFNYLQVLGYGDLVFADHHGWHIVAVHAVFVVFEGAVLVYMARLLVAEVEQSEALVSSAGRLAMGDLTTRAPVSEGPTGAAARALNDATDALASIVGNLTARAAETGLVRATLGSAVDRQRAAATAVGVVVARFAEGAARQRIGDQPHDRGLRGHGPCRRARRGHGARGGLDVGGRGGAATSERRGSWKGRSSAIGRMEEAVRVASRTEPFVIRAVRARGGDAADHHRHRGSDQHAGSQRRDRSLARGHPGTGLRRRGRGGPPAGRTGRAGGSGGEGDGHAPQGRHRTGADRHGARTLRRAKRAWSSRAPWRLSLQELKATSVAGIADVQKVARLAQEIAAQTHRILGDSSDGVARRAMRALAEVSDTNARSAAEAAEAAKEIESTMTGIAAAASDLDRISDGLRGASERFQV